METQKTNPTLANENKLFIEKKGEIKTIPENRAKIRKKILS
tara:strand:+ start:10293 stop:10415 length:123 start_codon:yes stop_codon:yes gene_type:complete